MQPDDKRLLQIAMTYIHQTSAQAQGVPIKIYSNIQLQIL